MLKMLEVH